MTSAPSNRGDLEPRWPGLPATPHRPGSTARPGADHPASRMARRVVAAPTQGTWRSDLPYLYGHALLRAGFHWEAHELWEAVWLASAPNSRERALLQGLIQLANAALKLAMSRPGAGRRLVLLAAGHFREVDPSGAADPLLGVAAGGLAQALPLLAARIDATPHAAAGPAAHTGPAMPPARGAEAPDQRTFDEHLICIILHNTSHIDGALHGLGLKAALPTAVY